MAGFDVDAAVKRNGEKLKTPPPEDHSYSTDEDYAPPDEGHLARIGRLAKQALKEATAKKENPVDTVKNFATYGPKSLAQAGSSQAAGLAGSVAAGGMGLATTAFGLGVGDEAGPAMEEGAKSVRKTQDTLSYEPSTAGGKLVNELLSAPLSLASEYGGKVGGAVGGAIGSLGGERGRQVGENMGQTFGEATPAAAATLLGLRALKGGRTPVPKTGRVPPPEPPVGSDKFTEPQLRQAFPKDALDRAESFVGKTSFKWGELPMKTRAKLAELAKDAETFGKLNPKELEAQMKAESMGIDKMSKGQITRDPAQLQLEDTLKKTEEGKPLREIDLVQNEKLTGKVDQLKGSTTGSTAGGMKAAGEKVVGFLTKAEKASAKAAGDVYKKVEDSPEINNPVSPKGLIKWLTENGAAGGTITEIPSLANYLKKFDAVGFDKKGNPIAKRDFTIGQMEEVKRFIDKLDPRDGSRNSRMMGEARQTILKSLEKAGGDLYKDARAAWAEHKTRFDDPDAVARLLKETSRTDRKVDFENVWHDIAVKGSESDIIQVRDRFLKDIKDPKLKAEGQQVWRDIQAHTIEWLRDEATKGLATNELREKNFSASGYSRALDKVGRGNLEAILGPKVTKKLYEIKEVAVDLKTKPPTGYSGSDTAPRILQMLTKLSYGISHVPMLGTVGNLAVGGVKHLEKMHEKGKDAKAAQAASTYDPVVEAQPKYDLSGRNIKALKKGAPAGYAGAEQGRK